MLLVGYNLQLMTPVRKMLLENSFRLMRQRQEQVPTVGAVCLEATSPPPGWDVSSVLAKPKGELPSVVWLQRQAKRFEVCRMCVYN